MAINRITNTPILHRHYSSLSLRQMRHQTHMNLVVQPNGTLWAALCYPADRIQVYRSTDNGFSWSLVITDTTYNQRDNTGGSNKGPLIWLVIEEQYRNLDIISIEWEGIGSTFEANRNRYQLDDLTAAPTGTAGFTSNTAATNGVADFCFTHRNGYFVFVDGGANVGAMLLSPRATGVSSEVDYADTAAAGPGPAVCCDEDGVVYVAYTRSGRNWLRFNKFTSNESNGTWGSAVTVTDLGSTDNWPDDVVIARDGYGNLCVAFAQRDTSDNDTVVKYAISTNNGVTWSTTTVSRESGFEQLYEPVNSLAVNYVDMIAGSTGGFLLTYADKSTSDSKAHTFVKLISTSDGGWTYTEGDAKEIGIQYAGSDIAGGKFFRPTESIRLMDLTDPGHVRIAYNVGFGSDADGCDDMSPVILAQELLSQNAYKTQLTADSANYSFDTADSNSILVDFVIYGSPQDNIDFYTKGLTGPQTTKYINAFKKVGTNIRLIKHEPDSKSWMNDQSAYKTPTETNSLAIFEPRSYSFPVQSIAAGNQDDWIEQDIRKLYLPANKHLDRTFLINEGGFLKRTVWLTQFDGNEYELSQVVPHFISNQICYYEVNAYVVGPSRDPFSRTVLPSET